VEVDIWDSHDPKTLLPVFQGHPLHNAASSTCIFDLLAAPSDIILPRLRRISLHCAWNDERNDPDKMRNMIESRLANEQISPLESLKIWCTADIPKERTESYIALRDLGVNVSVLVDSTLEMQRQAQWTSEWN
jgi:hypothetical protein